MTETELKLMAVPAIMGEGTNADERVRTHEVHESARAALPFPWPSAW